MIRIDIDQNTNFWPALYLPTSGRLLVVPRQHVAEPRQPGAVLALPEVGPPEAEEQTEEAEEQHHADPGMDRPRRLPAAEQGGQEEQLGWNSARPVSASSTRHDRRDPVVDARAGRVAVDGHRIARMDAVARLDIVRRHDRPLPASRLALPHPRARPGWAPRRCDGRSRSAAKTPMTARPAYLVTPFQTSTIGLILGLFGRPA